MRGMDIPIKLTWLPDGVLLEGHPVLVEDLSRALQQIADDIRRDAKQMRPATPPPNPLDPNTYVYPDDDD